MGPNESHHFLHNSSNIKMNRQYFEYHHIIGKGGFSKVWKVLFKKNHKLYAMKEMSKVKIIDRKSEQSIKSERNFLSKLSHPFIVNMNYSFQDYDNLYLIMDLLSGGDLRFHICRFGTFTEEQTKFFIGCLILALEFIHNNKIIHRDIKPENLVCDDSGYVRLTDFGIAKMCLEDNSSETSGTPGYMAPEVICVQNHSYPADFFAIGVIGYEFMTGVRPYLGRNRKEIRSMILRKQVSLPYEKTPNGWSLEAVDFINRLLQRKVEKRLGCDDGIRELKNHRWFMGFNWEKLYNKTVKSPFTPGMTDNYDKNYCEADDKLDADTIERYHRIMKSAEYSSAFRNYTYIDEGELTQYIERNLSQFQQQQLQSNLSLHHVHSQSSIGADQRKTMMTTINDDKRNDAAAKEEDEYKGHTMTTLKKKKTLKSRKMKGINPKLICEDNPYLKQLIHDSKKHNHSQSQGKGGFGINSRNHKVTVGSPCIVGFSNNSINDYNTNNGKVNIASLFNGNTNDHSNTRDKNKLLSIRTMDASHSSKCIPFKLPALSSNNNNNNMMMMTYKINKEDYTTNDIYQKKKRNLLFPIPVPMNMTIKGKNVSLKKSESVKVIYTPSIHNKFNEKYQKKRMVSNNPYES